MLFVFKLILVGHHRYTVERSRLLDTKVFIDYMRLTQESNEFFQRHGQLTGTRRCIFTDVILIDSLYSLYAHPTKNNINFLFPESLLSEGMTIECFEIG